MKGGIYIDKETGLKIMSLYPDGINQMWRVLGIGGAIPDQTTRRKACEEARIHYKKPSG